ncbi:metallophosphoesterase family protein [Pontibacter brevis]
MVQCLERSGFDMEKDQLFFLGDVVDGWSETMESIDLLLSIGNLVYLLGNHDQWALEFYTGKMLQDSPTINLWLLQGGAATVKSYKRGRPMPQEHLELLKQAKAYHVTEDNILMVHAGFDTSKPIEDTAPDYLIWKREFVQHCYYQYTKNKPVTVAQYKEVYIGHTPTIALNAAQKTPLRMGNVVLTDTGAAFYGCLSIMDIDSKEVWQSDEVRRLYPYEEGRNGTSCFVESGQG